MDISKINELINDHKTNKEIADMLGVSYNKLMCFMKNNNINRYTVNTENRKKHLKEMPTKKDLYCDYVECNLSLSDLGNKYCLSQPTIRKLLKEFNITKPKENIIKSYSDKIKKFSFTYEQLYDLYINQELSSIGISKKYKCSKKTVLDNLRKYKLIDVKNDSIRKTKSVENLRNTSVNRYGVEYPMQSKIVQDKCKNTNMQKYGVKYTTLLHSYSNSAINSKPNIGFAKLLEEYNIDYEKEFALDSYRYDFKVGNVLIEIDPSATHNINWGFKATGGKDKLYHYNKTRTAIESGYRCIHVFDWDNKNNVVEMLKTKTSIAARKCSIREVDPYDAKQFINTYHNQGNCKGQKIFLGLYYNDELYQIMTFGKPRYNKKYEYELLRLCTKFEYNIVGGASKLFKYFVKKYTPKSVISYCDISKFSGEVYEKLGFHKKRLSPPSRHWVKPKGLVHITDNLLRQKGFDQLFGTNYGKGTSNDELMRAHKFVEVYDCGQATYVYTK